MRRPPPASEFLPLARSLARSFARSFSAFSTFARRLLRGLAPELQSCAGAAGALGSTCAATSGRHTGLFTFFTPPAQWRSAQSEPGEAVRSSGSGRGRSSARAKPRSSLRASGRALKTSLQTASGHLRAHNKCASARPPDAHLLCNRRRLPVEVLLRHFSTSCARRSAGGADGRPHSCQSTSDERRRPPFAPNTRARSHWPPARHFRRGQGCTIVQRAARRNMRVISCRAAPSRGGGGCCCCRSGRGAQAATAPRLARPAAPGCRCVGHWAACPNVEWILLSALEFRRNRQVRQPNGVWAGRPLARAGASTAQSARLSPRLCRRFRRKKLPPLSGRAAGRKLAQMTPARIYLLGRQGRPASKRASERARGRAQLASRER